MLEGIHPGKMERNGLSAKPRKIVIIFFVGKAVSAPKRRPD
jgi:hypothetical protein